jgi:hypothetical protein
MRTRSHRFCHRPRRLADFNDCTRSPEYAEFSASSREPMIPLRRQAESVASNQFVPVLTAVRRVRSNRRRRDSLATPLDATAARLHPMVRADAGREFEPFYE